MFVPKIKEFGSRIKQIEKYGNRLYLTEEDMLWCVRGTEYKPIKDFSKYEVFKLTQEGMWFTVKERFLDKPDQLSIFFDLFENGKAYPSQPYRFSHLWTILGDRGYGVRKGKDSGLLIKDLFGDVIKSLPGPYGLGPVVAYDKIFVRSYGLICLDFDLKEIWRYSSSKMLYSRVRAQPEIYKRTVICNLGENKEESRGEFEIVCLDVEDGSLVWKVVLPSSPGSSNLVGDNVYVTSQDRMMVISAASGDILVDEPHGFTADIHNCLYPFDNGLLAISEPEGIINFFSQDGKKLLQKINMPKEYSISHHDIPIEFEGSLYLNLFPVDMNFTGAWGALLILTPGQTAKSEMRVQFPLRPVFNIQGIKNEKGENEHIVSISHDNIDEIILYGTIVLKEIALKTSSWLEPRKRDKRHNGVIHLKVDLKALGTGFEQKLEVIPIRVKRYLKQRGETAGRKKTDFKVLIEELSA